MKKLLVLFAILFTTPIFAQITLEHTYSGLKKNFSFAQIDSNEYVYIFQNLDDTIFIYDLNHSLTSTIVVPSVGAPGRFNMLHLSRRLFNLDDKIEFLITKTSGSTEYLRIFNETGDSLFGCEQCAPRGRFNNIADESYGNSIFYTSQGFKLALFNYKIETVVIYSLPGKLPTSNTKLSVTDAPTIISSSSPSTSAYPNPSNGRIRVAYSLPEGVTTGELVITSADGREVKRYRVGNMFNDILIEKSELASGAYFNKLITERGQSEARKFVITN